MSGLIGHCGLLLGRQIPAGGDPTTIPNLTMWIDATDASTLLTDFGGTPVTTDGALVGYARSKGSINRCIRIPSDTNKPTLRKPVVNGKSVLRFDGSNDFMQTYSRSGDASGSVIPSSAVFSASERTAIFGMSIASARNPSGMVYQYDAVVSDNGQYLLLHVANLDASNLNLYAYNYDTAVRSAATPMAKSTFSIVSLRQVGGIMSIRVNGGAWSSVSSGNTGNMTGALNIALSTGSGTYIPMDLAHLAFYNVGHSDASIRTVEEWMAAELGISLI